MKLSNKLIKFIINGIFITIGTLIILNILYYFGINYYISTISSYIIMILINYIISYKFIFYGKKSIKSFLNFLSSNIIGFTLFSIINIYLYKIGINIYIAQIVATLFSAISNFLYNNYITFKK